MKQANKKLIKTCRAVAAVSRRRIMNTIVSSVMTIPTMQDHFPLCKSTDAMTSSSTLERSASDKTMLYHPASPPKKAKKR